MCKTYVDLCIKYKDKMVILSEKFLDAQKCWDRLPRIKQLYYEKLEIYDKIENETKASVLKGYGRELTRLEFALQKAFKFYKNINYHRFWEAPKCTCPKLDNKDRHPYGHYIISEDCPLHGK